MPKPEGPGIAGLARFGGSPQTWPQTPIPDPSPGGTLVPGLGDPPNLTPDLTPVLMPFPIPCRDRTRLRSDPVGTRRTMRTPSRVRSGSRSRNRRPLSTHRTRARFLTAVWRTATQQQHTIGTDSMPDRVADRDAILIVHAAAKHSTLDVFTTKLLSHQTVRLLTCSSPHLLFL